MTRGRPSILGILIQTMSNYFVYRVQSKAKKVFRQDLQDLQDFLSYASCVSCLITYLGSLKRRLTHDKLDEQ
jgi:hypothetical protein